MSEQSADNQRGLREVWKKTLGRITKGRSKTPHVAAETQPVEKASRLTEPIGSFAQLEQRYKDMVNVAIGVNILQNADSQLITDWYRYIHQSAESKTASKDLPRKTKVDKAIDQLLNNSGAQAYKVTREQAEAAANVYITFSDLLTEKPFDYESLGYDEHNNAIVNHMSYLKSSIEHLASLPPDKLAELIKQKHEWEINPAAINRRGVEAAEAAGEPGLKYVSTLSQIEPDVDYKTALKERSDLEGLFKHMASWRPEEIHMLKLYEKAFAPYFQRGPGFGPQ